MNPIRKYPRIKCDMEGEVVLTGEKALPFSVRLTQLGQGGALLQPTFPLEIKKKFLLRLPLPTGRVELLSTVRYQFKFSDEAGEGEYVGVEFANAHEAPRELTGYIEQMLPDHAIFVPAQ